VAFLHFVDYSFWEIKMVGKKSTQNSKILQLKGLNVNPAATVHRKTLSAYHKLLSKLRNAQLMLLMTEHSSNLLT
jgi:hypothetical protein